MQTKLEKKGIEARNTSIIRNDYNKTDEYSERHKDAISDGDVLGKGTGGGMADHTHPGNNFEMNPELIGGKYDVEGRNGVGGRNFLMTINTYSSINEYGPNLITTDLNQEDGQIVIKY